MSNKYSKAEATWAVLALFAVALPTELVAVCTTLRYLPSSADTAVYVVFTAPLIFAHPVLPSSLRCHWKVSVGVGRPDEVAAVAVRVWFTFANPLIVGTPSIDGVIPATGAFKVKDTGSTDLSVMLCAAIVLSVNDVAILDCYIFLNSKSAPHPSSYRAV